MPLPNASMAHEIVLQKRWACRMAPLYSAWHPSPWELEAQLGAARERARLRELEDLASSMGDEMSRMRGSGD